MSAPTRTTGTLDLTVVVPAYNEEERLGPTLAAITGHLQENEDRWGTWEVVVVDDGSTDGTRDLVTGLADPRVQLVTSPRNRGKGHALRLGVAASRGARVLVTDADLAAPIEELEVLDEALTEGHAAAIGSRSVPGATIEHHQHRVRELLGRAGNLLIRRVAVPGIRDTQCGFKLFDGDRARTAFAASRLNGWGIDVEVLQHFRRADWPVAEIPVRWAHQSGSKVRPLDYARVLAELAALKARAVRPADLLAVTLFLLMAVALYAGRWIDPAGRYLPDSLQDQNQWEWFFAVTADNIGHLRNPLFTDLQGFPDGVNLMANTVMLGLSVPFAPITLLAGPAVSLALVMTLGLAATATAWYWLIVKRLVRQRGAAFAGAALATFAPPMVSHANAHPNFVILFMMPLIIDRALRLCEGERVTRNGVILGLMAAYQIFLGEEPLLLAAMGMVLFALAYAVVRREVAKAAWRPLLRGLLIGVAVCLPIVAFPLYWQFFGPQSYKSVLHGDNAGNSPLALLSFAERSLVAGDADRANALSLNPTEQNAFYGWPLVLLAFAIVVRLWERTLVKALAFTAVAAAFLSLGPEFRVPLTRHRAAGALGAAREEAAVRVGDRGPGRDDLRARAGHAAGHRAGTAGGHPPSVHAVLRHAGRPPRRAADRPGAAEDGGPHGRAALHRGRHVEVVRRQGRVARPRAVARSRQRGGAALADGGRPRLQAAGRVLQRAVRRRARRHLRRRAPLHLQHAAGRALQRRRADDRRQLAGPGQEGLRVLEGGRAGAGPAGQRRGAARDAGTVDGRAG